MMMAAVDEGELVVFLEEDDEAVGELDAFGLLGLEGVERRDGDLLPRLARCAWSRFVRMLQGAALADC